MSYSNFILISVLFICATSCTNSVNTSTNASNAKENSIISTDTLIIPTEKTKGEIIVKISGCGYDSVATQNTIELYMPRDREVNQINSILEFSGVEPNFKIYSASINNAIATIIDNQRYILYDPNLLSSTDKYSGHYWSSMSILAHEIGHHLSGHTISGKGSNPHDELVADKYSGFVLYKLGATLSQATSAMLTLASETGSVTHPAKNLRIQAIENGWNDAFNQRYKGAIPPPPNDKASDYYEFTTEMLLNKDLINDAKEYSPNFYSNQFYLYGVITEVGKDYHSVRIRIIKTSKEFSEDFRNLDNEEWEIGISSSEWDGSNEMCHACAFNFKSLMCPGRRLKFAMVEGWPGGGTIMNGTWTLIYAKAVDEI